MAGVVHYYTDNVEEEKSLLLNMKVEKACFVSSY